MTTIPGTVLALCAHPDDAEIFCGGTLLLLAQQGWRVHIATLSTGDCGSAEEGPNAIAARRRAEAQAAAEYLGGEYHCLNGQDLQLFDNNAMRAAAVTLIRSVNPDCVMTHYPTDYMPDHEAASAVARAAVFAAPIRNYVVGPASAIPATTHMAALYYFGSPLGGVDYFGNPILPRFHVDISSAIEQKAQLLACHASQRDWLRRQHGIDQYIEEMKEWGREAGHCAGVAYAEGFTQHLGHAFPQTPLLQQAVREAVRQPLTTGVTAQVCKIRRTSNCLDC